DIQGGKLGNKNSTTHLVGKNVYIDADSTNLNSTINVTATEGGYIQRQMINFANDGYKFGNNTNINIVNYTDSSGTTHTGSSNFKKALTIGNMGNEKDNAIEWWHFAKGWNEGLGVTRSIDEFRLVGNIDFSGNKGQGTEGKDWQNYANYCIDGLGCTSMIVGSTDTNAFTKTFNGQSYALKNINMDITTLEDKSEYKYIGIFGNSDGANFKNINIDYMNGKIQKQKNVKDGWRYIGGFIGKSKNSFFEYVSLSNIESISNSNRDDNSVVGGFAGSASGTFSNISLNNIRNIENSADDTWTGGFAGSASGTFSNISLNNIENISSYSDYGMYGGWSRAGGFAGTTDGTFSNISLNNIKNISSRGGNYGNIYGNSFAGGFVGESSDSNFNNISLNSIEKITAYGAWGGYAGGFAGGVGYPHRASFSNIFIYFNPNIILNARKDSSGKLFGKLFLSHNAFLDNIHIYHHENDLGNATADQNYWGSTSSEIQIHTYDDSTQNDAYNDFLSKANTIEKPSKPTDPIDSDIILGSDDLYADIIMKWIIDELRKENYTIDIKNLVSLINAFKGLNKESREDEIKAIVKAHLDIKDDDKALSMAQGISFLLNYKEHNFDKRLNDEALAVYNNTIKPSVNNTLGIISYLDKNKDYLLEQYNKHKELEQVFKDKEQAYKNAEAEFNRLLDLVNKGKLGYDDPKFTQAFDNWLNAYNTYNALSNDISELNNNVAKIANYITDENKGLAYTKFSFTKFDDISKIDLVKPELPDIDNSQGGDLPAFEQTASLNLIGDNALDDDDEKKEIDE
ncbi:hypothetical protein, partial [Campylobacter sp. FU_497]|uniref:hypothetical protein n=1 Tax=Campylobacter sp. FU_497 TaxID=2911610 RepID=UPI0021E6CFCE